MKEVNIVWIIMPLVTTLVYWRYTLVNLRRLKQLHNEARFLYQLRLNNEKIITVALKRRIIILERFAGLKK